MNFVGDLLRSAGNILKNPSTASVNLFGTNVPMVPLISQRDHFLRMLSTWSGSIPNQFMWMVLIDRFPPAVSTQMLQKFEPRGDGGNIGNNIDKNLRTTAGYLYQRVAGCYFAQGATLPGEATTYQYSNVNKPRGFIGGMYADPRATLQPLTLQFMETNTSFVDFTIRPWTILASHLGLVARPGDDPASGNVDDQNIKTNITIIQLAKTYQGRSPVQRKVWRFYNCVPFSVSTQELQTGATDVERISTQWAYTNYTVGGLPFVPIEEIIESFSSGKLPNIINGITQVTGIDPINKGIGMAKKVLGL